MVNTNNTILKSMLTMSGTTKGDIIKDLQRGINQSLVFELIRKKEQWNTPSWFGKTFLEYVGIYVENTYVNDKVKQKILNVDISRLKYYLNY